MTAYHYITKSPRITLTSVNCQKMTYFYTIPDKGTFSKMLLKIKSVFWFLLQPFTEHLLSDWLSYTLPKMHTRLHEKHRLLWKYIHKIEFSQYTSDKSSSIYYQKFGPLGTELFHVEERTDGHANETN